MLQELRYNKKAKPYARVEYMHGDMHQVVDLPMRKAPSRFQWFFLGALWAGLVAVIVWTIW